MISRRISYLICAVTVYLAVTVFGARAYTCDNPDEWLLGNDATRRDIWPNATVKFELDSSLKYADYVEVRKAFNDIHSKTCIRFRPKESDDVAYTSIRTDDDICGMGHICYTGGLQFATFGGSCKQMNTMVHQLGHNLCLNHEELREDRDQYLQYQVCPADKIPGKTTGGRNELRGSLYDYSSQMHGRCDRCEVGFPRQSGVRGCGPQVQVGLSVMDADKLNELYNCGGCFAHRWRPINNLTEEDKLNMVPLGTRHSGSPWYACRAIINGELVVGKYDTPTCFLAHGGEEHFRWENAQVLTDPSGSFGYRVVPIKQYLEGRVSGKAVPSGRTEGRKPATGYIAVTLEIIEREDTREKPVGKVYDNEWDKAIFPFYGQFEVMDDFGIVVCG